MWAKAQERHWLRAGWSIRCSGNTQAMCSVMDTVPLVACMGPARRTVFGCEGGVCPPLHHGNNVQLWVLLLELRQPGRHEFPVCIRGLRSLLSLRTHAACTISCTCKRCSQAQQLPPVHVRFYIKNGGVQDSKIFLAMPLIQIRDVCYVETCTLWEEL